MSDGGPESLDARRTALDPRLEVDRTNALHERLFGDVLGALELYTIHLGERLGLYGALAKSGPATSSQLAARTGTSERYVREWLEQHAASDLLAVDDPRAEPLARRYRLPPEHIAVLANPDDADTSAYTGVDIVRAGRGLPQLVRRFALETRRRPCRGSPRAELSQTGLGSSICLARNGSLRLSTST
jgi:Rv2258c-like winged HTH domain